MCQFPGCESEHRLHAHHIVHWANGGPTELGNLISACSFHHHKLHEGGWNIIVTDDGFGVDPAIEPLLSELEQFEIDAALADFDCNEPLADRFEAVEREVQQAYVDRNQPALDDYIAALPD